jgi:hypothetical protein
MADRCASFASADVSRSSCTVPLYSAKRTDLPPRRVGAVDSARRRFASAYHPVEVALSLRAHAGRMIDPYDPYDDPPGGPMASTSWLDDWESMRCSACGQPAASWTYEVGTGADGSMIIDGYSVCAAHKAAA